MSDTTEQETPADPPVSSASELGVLTQCVAALRELDKEGQARILRTLGAYFEIPVGGLGSHGLSYLTRSASPETPPSRLPSSFSEDRTPSPKEFLSSKRPQTDVDRIACLAYYLTHYRSTPHFKTLDLSKLNTEAAQLKFSNAAWATENATKAGLLVPAAKGTKQVSAIGESYVQALPDRTAAKAVLGQGKKRRRPNKNKRTGGAIAEPKRSSETGGKAE